MRILLIILSFTLLQYSYTQESSDKSLSKKEKREKEFAEMKKIVEGRSMIFVAKSAHPQGGGRVDLTTNPNFLKIMVDSAHAALPFFGRAYNVPYGGGNGGIKFNGKMENYVLKTIEKKYSFQINFKVKEGNESFDCTLSIFRSGSATLSVTSVNRAFISYQGQVEELKEDEMDKN